ncbi:hypothetical protein ACRAWD_28205 [Caulobacter segnis]
MKAGRIPQFEVVGRRRRPRPEDEVRGRAVREPLLRRRPPTPRPTAPPTPSPWPAKPPARPWCC